MKNVSKQSILVDPSTSNTPIMREAAWEQIRNVMRTIGLIQNLSDFHKLRIIIFLNYGRGGGSYDHTNFQIH